MLIRNDCIKVKIGNERKRVKLHKDQGRSQKIKIQTFNTYSIDLYHSRICNGPGTFVSINVHVSLFHFSEMQKTDFLN